MAKCIKVTPKICLQIASRKSETMWEKSCLVLIKNQKTQSWKGKGCKAKNLYLMCALIGYCCRWNNKVWKVNAKKQKISNRTNLTALVCGKHENLKKGSRAFYEKCRLSFSLFQTKYFNTKFHKRNNFFITIDLCLIAFCEQVRRGG